MNRLQMLRALEQNPNLEDFLNAVFGPLDLPKIAFEANSKPSLIEAVKHVRNETAWGLLDSVFFVRVNCGSDHHLVDLPGGYCIQFSAFGKDDHLIPLPDEALYNPEAAEEYLAALLDKWKV